VSAPEADTRVRPYKTSSATSWKTSRCGERSMLKRRYFYSVLSARIGSTRVARRAGTNDAINHPYT
jgi:hypothetical protein